MYDVICLPTDGSEAATDALEHAIAAAAAHDATLHIISVADRRVHLAAEPDEKDQVLEELRSDAHRAVDRLTAAPEASDVTTVTAVREGVPHREILAYAAEHDVDLLVLGTHGRTGREKRLNLGSTTERVVKAGERPVLVVDIG